MTTSLPYKFSFTYKAPVAVIESQLPEYVVPVAIVTIENVFIQVATAGMYASVTIVSGLA